MNALNNPLAHAFFDDMADIGVLNWLKGAMVMALLGWACQGIVPYALVGGVIMTVNLLGVAIVSWWWDRHGRAKYAGGTIVDIGRAAQDQREGDR